MAGLARKCSVEEKCWSRKSGFNLTKKKKRWGRTSRGDRLWEHVKELKTNHNKTHGDCSDASDSKKKRPLRCDDES